MGNCNLIRKSMADEKKDKLPIIFTTDISKIPRHTYENQYRYVVFDHIYDGDTADIYFMDNNLLLRTPFRFYGYDSAEVKPLRTELHRDTIIKQAHTDREFLSALLRNNYLVVKFTANEKYGRMMGKVWKVTNVSIPESELDTHTELVDHNQINLMMIKGGHGKQYFGGKK